MLNDCLGGTVPKLTVQNAEIKTATVEVRTLTLSGKQVTLSVFKQIEEENLFDQTGDFAGEPWGRVNYCPGKCSERPHLHALWQKGNELRRTTAYPDRCRGLGQDAGEAAAIAAIHDQRWARNPNSDLEVLGSVAVRASGLFDPSGSEHVATFDFEGVRFGIALPQGATSANPPPNAKDRSWRQELAELSSAAATFKRNFAKVSALPQLFIAV